MISPYTDCVADLDQPPDVTVQQAVSMPAAIAASSAAPSMPFMTPVGYPGFFGQYPTMATGKPGEAPTYTYPQYYIPFAMPTHQATGQDGETPAYGPPGLIPATFVHPYAQQAYPGAPVPYMFPVAAPRADGQQQQIPMMPPPGMSYAYPAPANYVKPPSRENPNEMPPQMMDPARRDPRVEAYSARMGEGISASHGKSG